MKMLRQLTTCIMIVLLGALSMVASAQDAKRDEVVFFFNDALGSAVAAINEQGDLCWSEEYTGYGDKTINDDLVSPVGCGIIGEERGFTGHTEDVNSDLVYMQQRYYDPSIGRFLSIDPMDADPNNPMTYNRYAYGNNNPYKYVDPDGELPVLVWGAYVAATAALSAYDSYQAYQEDGVSGLAKQAAVDVGLSLAGAKIASKVAEGVIDGANALKVPDGIVYKRTDPKTGECYVGQCISQSRYDARQGEHDRALNANHEYEILDRAEPGVNLDVAEETKIREHGGLQREGGTLANKRHQMSEQRYTTNGGTLNDPNR